MLTKTRWMKTKIIEYEGSIVIMLSASHYKSLQTEQSLIKLENIISVIENTNYKP